MAASNSVDDVSGWLDERLAAASPDLLRVMVKQFAETLMSTEADTVCGAGYRERSDERVNSRNGYRSRDWDTRVGSVELAIPKLRTGSYFPDSEDDQRERVDLSPGSRLGCSVVASARAAVAPDRGVGDATPDSGLPRMRRST
jgi:hypothetical protein